MLESLRHLFKGRTRSVDLGPMKAWASAHGHVLRRVHDGEGCTVEPSSSRPAWRIEWGPSQRSYIDGRELRIIGEVGTPKELVAMVLTQALKESMERLVFEQYVEDVQTRLDADTPPEMRWLVMYTKLPASDMGRLRERYAAVSNVQSWVTQWMAGPLNDALSATLAMADESDPLVLAISRGRMTLRTPMAEVDDKLLAMWLTVFERAQQEAQRLGREWHESVDHGHSTMPSAWAKSNLPDEGSR